MARQKTIIGKVRCSPGDVIPCGLNWGPWLAKTADTLYDFDGTAPTIPVTTEWDSWFSNTFSGMKVGPVPRGRHTVNFDVVTEGEERYHRELIIDCR